MQFEPDIIAEDLESEGPTYTRSNGVKVPVKKMATPHLKSAHAKLEREFPGHPDLPGMAAEIAKRDEAYAAEQQAQQGVV